MCRVNHLHRQAESFNRRAGRKRPPSLSRLRCRNRSHQCIENVVPSHGPAIGPAHHLPDFSSRGLKAFHDVKTLPKTRRIRLVKPYAFLAVESPETKSRVNFTDEVPRIGGASQQRIDLLYCREDGKSLLGNSFTDRLLTEFIGLLKRACVKVEHCTSGRGKDAARPRTSERLARGSVVLPVSKDQFSKQFRIELCRDFGHFRYDPRGLVRKKPLERVD